MPFWTLISSLFVDTATGFVVTAVVVCLVMAATATILMRHAEACTGRQRAGWAALVAMVAGTGVWTTHFVAMLGYRPDAMLSYSVEITLLSAAVGVVCVGGPLALACYLHGAAKAAAGGVAGLGVGVMHFTGMSALEGCRVAYEAAAVYLSLVLGIVAFAFAMLVRWRPGGVLRMLLLAAGVCALHFTALSGVTLEFVPANAGRTFDANLLSMLVTMASLGLSIASAFAISTVRRFDAQRQEASDAELRRHRIFSLAMRNMSNGLVMIDAGGVIVAFNDRVLELNHLEPGELAEGQHLEDLLAAIGHRNGWSDDMLVRMIANHRAWIAKSETTHVDHKFDNGRVLNVACRPMADGGAVFTYDDVTERYSAEATITEIRYRDALTGLPNRRAFRETVATELEAGTLGPVLLLDLDRFKSVNETLGHQVGDRLLVEVAKRLSVLVPEGRLHRIGGDGLAVLPRLGSLEEGQDLAQRLIAALEAPFVVRRHRIGIGCCIGLACGEGGDDADLVLQKAELALVRAKSQGRNSVDAYEAGMMEQARDRGQLETDLARAIEDGELFLQYQPLCSLPDERLTGFEALVRWRHPERGLISPADFIPLAEENGAILDVGAWVLDEACRQAVRWPSHVQIAVNVSAVQMRAPGIVEQIAGALRRHGLDPARLELEITETALVEDGRTIAESLRQLRGLGVRVAMDDFGTGYSSLAHLRQFEIDRIKIDRSFVSAADKDPEARAVVRAVTSMAREMSLVTTGEGVSSREQLQLLAELGCDTAQGFYIGRPVNAEVADRLVAIQNFDDDAQADVAPSVVAPRLAFGA